MRNTAGSNALLFLPKMGWLAMCLIFPVANSCFTPRRAIVQPSPAVKEGRQPLLALELKRVEIQGYHMHEALEKLADAIQATSRGKVRFIYTTSWKNQLRYTRIYTSPEQWPSPDPLVHINASNVRLQTVLDILCQQSGWSYEFTETGMRFLVDAPIRKH
jgi:hypothetical protein